MRTEPTAARTPADSSIFGHNANNFERGRRADARQEAREFLARANRIVDEIHMGSSVALNRELPPARFTREPDIFLRPLRFGRTRLLLSKVIGRAAWRGWVTL